MKEFFLACWRYIKSVTPREWLGTAADILVFVLLAIDIFKPHFKGLSPEDLIVRVFCYIFVINLVLLLWTEGRSKRLARHAEAQSSVHEAYHKCRDAWFLIQTTQAEILPWAVRVAKSNGSDSSPPPKLDNEAIHSLLKEATVHMAAAISLISGVKCRVYVRELCCADPTAEPLERGFVTTTFFSSDQVIENADAKHFITDDSHILALWSHPRDRCFFDNNVAKIPSFRMSGCPAGKHFDVNSVAVWPIRKYKEVGQPEVVGYLCVDSQASSAFNKRYDFPLGAAFADTLYPLLSGWRSVKNAPALLAAQA